ncbi:MAG: transcriptional regulator [Candidatus Lokiarchaeota archaeon]|nr:transcriptional regulator [Candidatus Lokiarchaeota archaeon]MBD3339896.1 transcriptional regulator [Candidatus Lokiarchaeota archaeon]
MQKETNDDNPLCSEKLHNNKEICLCSIEGIINLISKKWVLLIISLLREDEKLRFNKIMDTLDGISPKTLSDRLKELKLAGLLNRKAYAEIPPRVEYSLTQDGIKLRNLMAPLIKWASERSK